MKKLLVMLLYTFDRVLEGHSVNFILVIQTSQNR